jgi:hypothetical protein
MKSYAKGKGRLFTQRGRYYGDFRAFKKEGGRRGGQGTRSWRRHW